MKSLLDEGATVSAYDPEATEKAKTVLPNIVYCTDPYEAAQDADAVLILTEWEEFRTIDWQRLGGVVERRLIIDGRNMFNARDVSAHGFHYVSIGRPPALSARKTLLADDAQLAPGSKTAAQDLSW